MAAVSEAAGKRFRERLVLGGLIVFFLLTVLPSLGDDPIVGGDEGWIISASARLADEGVFGSDLFAGFYGAEEHYYFNLPLHHLLLAGVFEIFGVGVLQARALSVVYGLAALVLTYLLGRRIGGPAVGLGAAALLVLLRLNLAPFSGLTLTDLGATVRYDLIATAYGAGAALVLAYRPHAPSPFQAAGAGLLVGLAALTQFIGAFFALPAALYLLSTYPSAGRRALLLTAFGAAMILPFLPYFGYIALDWDDFRGQARAVEQETDFLSPSFYLAQLEREPDRLALATGLEEAPQSLRDLVRRPSARLALFIAIPVATAYAAVRAARGSAGGRLPALFIVALVLQLALLESTKRFVYWVVVVPFVCVALADLAAALWRLRASNGAWRRAVLVAAVVIAGVFFVEGAAVGVKDARDAPEAPDYAALRRRLDEALPEGAVAIGDNRLWPALRQRPYRSLLLLFYHTNPSISRERATDVFGAMARIDADYLLLSPLSREVLRRLSPRDSADFGRFLNERTRLVATVEDGAYGPIDVYRVGE